MRLFWVIFRHRRVETLVFNDFSWIRKTNFWDTLERFTWLKKARSTVWGVASTTLEFTQVEQEARRFFAAIRTQMLWYEELQSFLRVTWLHSISNSEIHQWTIHLQMCQNVATNSSYSIGHLTQRQSKAISKQSVPSITPSRSFNIYYGTKVFTAFIMGGPIHQDKSNHYYWLLIWRSVWWSSPLNYSTSTPKDYWWHLLRCHFL